MRVFASTWLRGGALALMTAYGAVPAVRAAEAFLPWRLTSVRGYAVLETRYNDYTVRDTREREPYVQEEIGIRTRSFAYHPNFLEMDIGGAVLFDQRSFTRDSPTLDSQTESTNDIGWSLDTRFNFLSKKPYPFSLYFDRQNPVVSTGLAGSFSQTNMQYGMDASLLAPLSPVNVDFGIFRTTFEGESVDQTVDDSNEQAYVNAIHSFFADSTTQLSYTFNRTSSKSGIRDRAIFETTRSDHSTVLVTRWILGSRKQYELVSTSNYDIQNDPRRVDTRIRPRLTWRHAPNLDSFYRYNFSKSSQPDNDDTDTLENGGSAGFRYEPFEALTTDGEVNFNISSEARGFDREQFGGNGSVKYFYPLAFGRLDLGANLGYTHNNQDAPSARRSVTDEPVTLVGTTPVTLARDFVLTSTVEVTNTARTQTFIEELDYRLITVGAQTELQRLAGGAILDGQRVLVSYDFQSGGDFSFSVLNQNYTSNLGIGNYYNVFARFFDLDQTVRSGEPTFTLNSVNVIEVGADADVPLWRWGIRVGGRIAYLRQDEDISPFDRSSINAFVQFPLPFTSRLRLAVRRSESTREGPGGSSDQTGFSADFRSRPWLRGTVTATFEYEKEKRGPLDRTRSIGNVRTEWRIRRLRVSATAEYVQETQDNSETERFFAILRLRRDW
jgi:hypothetical protein